MGQILSRIDETGINQIFVKAYNALNQSAFFPPELETQQNHDFGPGSAEVKFKIKFVVDDLAANAMPINLIGSGQSPQVGYSGLPVKLLIRVELRVRPDGLPEKQVNVTFDVVAMVAGGANVSVTLGVNSNNRSVYRARLELDASESTVSFASSLPAFQQAIQPLINSLPQPLQTGARNAAVALFNQAAAVAAQQATNALRSFADRLRVQVGHDIPKHWTVQTPGGDSVQFTISALVPTITGNALSLTATFS